MPAQEIPLHAIYSDRPSGYEMIEPYQTEAKFPAIAVVNDPKLLVFEEMPEESLENHETCYSQIVEVMPDQQSRAPQQI